MDIGKYKTLIQRAEQLGDPCYEKSLRREYHARRLEGIRLRPSSNSPILISDEALERWLTEHAAKRVNFPSPAQVTTPAAAASRTKRISNKDFKGKGGTRP